MDTTYQSERLMEAEKARKRAEEMAARKKAVNDSLMDALRLLGLDVSNGSADGVYLHLSIDEDRFKYSTYRRNNYGTGRLRVKFGGFGEVRQFPESKNGFDFARIAGEISRYVKTEKAEQQARVNRASRYETGKPLAERINTDLGLDWSTPRAESTGDGLMVRISAVCTEAQARALLAAWKENFRKAPVKSE